MGDRRFRLAAFALAVISVAAAGEFRRATDTGIDFIHADGRSGRRYFLETVGSGVALFDANGDGFLDIYFVNGAALPGIVYDEPPTNRLYLSNGDGTFTDATAAAGVGDAGYGAGVAVADYDNDGDPDIYVTNFGRNTLYRNHGDGTFTDATDAAGVGDERWSLSCAFADFDRDGWLDLYVTNYIDHDLDDHEGCVYEGVPIYCPPEGYAAAPDTLYRNNGDGTFTDATRSAGVFNPDGKGMGVTVGDYDLDGWPDIYVGNDVGVNYLYRNNGDGTFEDVAWIAGVEADENGYGQGTMGVDFGDIDNDGFPDLIALNYQNQPNALYRNEGDGFFRDMTFVAGMGYSLPLVGWGTSFFDADNDGDQDLFVANGHLQDRIEEFDKTTSYAQLNQLLVNDGSGRFENRADAFGDGLAIRKSSRGLAVGDLDNDGDLDLVVSNAADSPDILFNTGSPTRNWVQVALVGMESNRDGIGARVTVVASGSTQEAEVRAGTGYLSHNDTRLHFGLGTNEIAERIEVVWPTGAVDVVRQVAANRVVTIREGDGLR